MRRLSAAQARRAVLGAGGFADRQPSGAVDRRHFRRVMDRLAVLQLDSVNVVCRSHYLPILARLGPYDRDRLDDWLWRSREGFEYFAHMASITPMARQPLLRFRMAEGRWNAGKRLEEERPGYLAAVMEQVVSEGATSVSDLHDAGGRGGTWWGWSPGKVALDWLYITGRLAIDRRDGSFTIFYDLPERVVPPDVLAAPSPGRDEAIRELLALSVRAAGVGTIADLADWFRLPIREARSKMSDLVATGRAVEVAVEHWGEPAFADPELTIPRRIEGSHLLSPFDPVVWFRPRAERIFGFRYRIEIYVPAPKRIFGYYVLPLLAGDELVGRLDLKSDRARSVLLVRASHVELGADPVGAAEAATTALRELAGFLDLDEIEIDDRGDLAPVLRSIGP